MADAAAIRAKLNAIPGIDNLSFEELLLHADVAVFAKAIEWMLRFDEYYQADFLSMLRQVAAIGKARAEHLAAGRHPWIEASGRIARAYPSSIDGSLQPYVVVVPDNFDRRPRPLKRLDVVLHGRNGNLNEVWFLAKNDGKPAPVGQKNLELHVYGRGNNAYRWAGEADVHDAIEIVAREYGIDRRCIVLRGFSMGGAGAWQLGLQHPLKWMSVEAGAGFTDAVGRIKIGPLPAHQMAALKVYDAVHWTVNAGQVPIVCYGGEDDPQIQAPISIRDRLQLAGWRFTVDGLVAKAQDHPFTFIVGAKMGHRVDAASRRLMDRFHDEHESVRRQDLAKMDEKDWMPLAGESVGVCLTPKFGDVIAGVRIHRLDRLYEPATIRSRADGERLTLSTANILELEVRHPQIRSLEIDGTRLELTAPRQSPFGQTDGWLMRTEQGWLRMDRPAQLPGQPLAKRGNVCGPIDDAFNRSFLCVRGTGQPWNRAVHDWAHRRLDLFAAEWEKNLRGKIRIVDDVAYKPRDAKIHNLILFGDPGSNSVLAQLLDRLPLRWTKSTLELAGSHSSADCAPVLIYPNPDNPSKYVVLNSGHTFHQPDFEGTNALLFARLGDFAVLRVNSDAATTPIHAGFFDNAWRPSEIVNASR